MTLVSSEAALGIVYRPTDTPLIEDIRRAIKKDNQFTSPLVSKRVHVFDIDLALVFFKADMLAYACLASPSIGGTTGHRKVRFYDCIALEISTTQLRASLPIEHRDEFDKVNITSAGRPSPALWDALWDAVKTIRTDLLAELERLQNRREQKRFDFGNKSSEVYFQARDAVGTALEAAGINRSGVFSGFSNAYLRLTNLSQGLAGGLTEDVVIHHDARRMPGFIKAEDVGDAFRFQRRRRLLDVVVGNRRPLEQATGADLLYFNHRYCAYTFVQYKMMEQSKQGWIFRRDQQCINEMGRMMQFRSIFAQVGDAMTTCDSFRLHTDPFFFKLVKRDRLEMDSDELTKGMYLGLTHFERLMAMSSGARGGSVVTFESARRWLCKTSFVDLLADGWIGTRGVSEAQLLAWVDQALSEGRVIVAAQSGMLPKDASEKSPLKI